MMRDSLSRGSLIAVLVLIAASATAAEPGASKNGFVLFTPDARLRTAMPGTLVSGHAGVCQPVQTPASSRPGLKMPCGSKRSFNRRWSRASAGGNG